jgi:hypothetical protein
VIAVAYDGRRLGAGKMTRKALLLNMRFWSEPHRPPRNSRQKLWGLIPLTRGGRLRIASGLAIFDPTALATDAFEHPHDAAASCVQTLPNELGVSAASEASKVFDPLRTDDCIGTQTIHATLNRTSQGNAPKKSIRFEKSARSPK